MAPAIKKATWHSITIAAAWLVGCQPGPAGAPGAPGASCSVTAFDGGLTVSCPGSPPATVFNGVDASAIVDFATLSALEMAQLDLAVNVIGVTNAARPEVTFKVTDAKGRGVKNIAPAHVTGLALMKLEPGTSDNGKNIDTWVSYIANCPTCVSSTEAANAGSLVSVGDGTYRYTFAKDIQGPGPDGGTPGTTFDAMAPTRLIFALASTGNPFRPVNVVYEYIPATGTDITGNNEKVSTAACLECHGSFRANALNAGGASAFHRGQRYLVPFCLACHNDQRKYSGSLASGNAVVAEPTITGGVMTPPPGQTTIKVLRGEAVLNLPVWIHKIHRGKRLALRGPYPGGAFGAEMNEIRFPQDARNCTKCHKNAPLADNWKNKPSARACGDCHDLADFVIGSHHGGGAQVNDAGARTDRDCASCHTALDVMTTHLPVGAPDRNNILENPDGGSGSAHAAWLANPANLPMGASTIAYLIVDGGVAVTTGVDGGSYATVNFKMLKGGAPVVFNVYDGGSSAEMMDNSIGSASVYCAMAVPQDGLATPADFNVTINGYLKSLWQGTGGTLTGPDSAGHYTATLMGASVPTVAKMLTCGIGYGYNLSSAQPLTQIDLARYAYDARVKTGGLIVPAPNVWQVATGYSGRRGAIASTSSAGQVVSKAKCEGCHAPLGVSPTFHGAQRNDPATCAFCHTPNLTSGGWSANAGFYLHAIHGAAKRTVPFNWHAASLIESFDGVTFPARPQNCEICHNPGMYDFSAPWYTVNGGANVDNRLFFAAAIGTYSSDPLANPKGYYSISPYVVSDGGVNYGAGFSYNTSTQVATEAAPTTLVHSPTAGACFGCHDSQLAMAHMRTNGGSLYAPRATALVTIEQCLLCHGPGRWAAIEDSHSR